MSTGANRASRRGSTAMAVQASPAPPSPSGRNVLAAHDDQSLPAAGDVQFPVDEKAEVAGAPATGRDGRIADYRANALARPLDLADLAFRAVEAGVIDDADGTAANRPAEGDHRR